VDWFPFAILPLFASHLLQRNCVASECSDQQLISTPHPCVISPQSFMLYRLIGATGIDKHPNVAGQYLNALTFFSTLTGLSPIGAAPPLNTGSSASGDRPLTPAELLALQTAAAGTVKACGATCGVKTLY
jgi:hypothetical protein